MFLQPFSTRYLPKPLLFWEEAAVQLSNLRPGWNIQVAWRCLLKTGHVWDHSGLFVLSERMNLSEAGWCRVYHFLGRVLHFRLLDCRT